MVVRVDDRGAPTKDNDGEKKEADVGVASLSGQLFRESEVGRTKIRETSSCQQHELLVSLRTGWAFPYPLNLLTPPKSIECRPTGMISFEQYCTYVQ